MLAVGAVVLAAGIALTERLIRDSRPAVVLVVAAWAIDTLVGFDGIGLGPLLVNESDVVYVALLVAAIARMLRTDRFSPAQRVLVAFACVVAFAVARGVADHGLGVAVNESRKYLYLLGGALYFSTVPLTREFRDRVGRVVVGLGAILGVLAVARWAGQLVGVSAGVLQPAEPIRVLDAGDTLLVLVAFLLLFDRARGDRRSHLLGAALFSLVVVLQHRTLWVVTLVTLTVLVIRDRRVTGRMATLLAASAAIATILATTVFGDVSLAEELTDSASSTDTFEWRLEGWAILVAEQLDEPLDVLVGQPFGGGWERRIDGVVVSTSPHNFYVETFLRTGVLGLALLLGWFVAVTVRLSGSREKAGWLADRSLLLLVVGYGVYFLTYTPPTEHAMLIGIATAAAAQATRHRGRRPVLEDPTPRTLVAAGRP